ncbi:hypothetical protein BC628DRAFT_1481144 [Trametes gibbosa]|nr:hypothetical protein BC628DRAFT_1481144 [Trametes gibbosa]
MPGVNSTETIDQMRVLTSIESSSHPLNFHLPSLSIKEFTIAAAVSLLCWDYLLTLIEFFWKRCRTGGAILFFTNRYITLGYSIYTMMFWVIMPSTKGCVTATGFVYLEYLLECSQYATWAVFSCLRFYALRRQKHWAVLVLLLSLTPSFVVFTLGLHNSIVSLHSLSLVSRLSLIVGDFMVFAATWAATKEFRNQTVLCTPGRTMTLGAVLCKSGTLYFVIMTTMNALYLMTEVLSVCMTIEPSAFQVPERRTMVQEQGLVLFVNIFEDTYASITAILVSRFFFALQAAAANTGAASTYTSGGSLSADVNAGARSTPLSLLEFARADLDQLCRDGESVLRDDGRRE